MVDSTAKFEWEISPLYRPAAAERVFPPAEHARVQSSAEDIVRLNPSSRVALPVQRCVYCRVQNEASAGVMEGACE